MRAITTIGFPIVGESHQCQWGRGVKLGIDPLPCLGLADRRITVKRASDGKVRDFELCNPHLRIFLDAAEKDGTEVL